MLDFGNGIVAGGHASDAVRIAEHSGLDYPDVEQGLTENAVQDGGVLGAGRAAMRLMRLALDFDSTYTRRAVAQAFTYGVERTLTSTYGSMPYKVIGLGFASGNLTHPLRLLLTIVSPLACPEGDTLTATIAGGDGWDASGMLYSYAVADGYDQLTFLGAGTYEIGKGVLFSIAAPKKVESIKLYLGAAVNRTWDITADIRPVTGGVPGAAVASKTRSIALTSTVTEFEFVLDSPVELAAGDYVFSGFSEQAFDWWNELRFATDSTLGDVDASAMTWAWRYVDPMVLMADDTCDLKFEVTGRSVSGGVGSVTFDANTDVPCAPQITCVIVVGAADLVLTGGGWVTTVHGSFVTNDVIVVDARNFTVKVNGVDALADFVRTGDWPQLSPGSNTITVAPAAATSVQWKPRRLGLI